MTQLARVFFLVFFISQVGLFMDVDTAMADGDHSHPEEKMEMDMKMDMHKHSPAKKHELTLPSGTKEVKIELSGPFCHKHPEEITGGLMKLPGVVHIEAFSGRKYILAHYDDKKVSPEEMATVIDGLKGSGWRCEGTVSSKKRTER